MNCVRKVERKLQQLGEDKTRRLKWVELFSLVKQMRYKATTRDKKIILFSKLKEHMVRRLLWKTSNNCKPAKTKLNRTRNRTAKALEGDSSVKCKSSFRRSKRMRGNTAYKKTHVQRKIQEEPFIPHALRLTGASYLHYKRVVESW